MTGRAPMSWRTLCRRSLGGLPARISQNAKDSRMEPAPRDPTPRAAMRSVSSLRVSKRFVAMLARQREPERARERDSTTMRERREKWWSKAKPRRPQGGRRTLGSTLLRVAGELDKKVACDMEAQRLTLFDTDADKKQRGDVSSPP